MLNCELRQKYQKMLKFYSTMFLLSCVLAVQAVVFPYLQNPQPTQMTVMWPSTNDQQAG